MSRSLLLRFCLIGLGVVAFLMLLLHLARVVAEQRFVATLGPLEPAGYTLPPTKSDANAARYFLAACGKLRVNSSQAQLLAAWNPSTGETLPAALRTLLQENEASLQLAFQGASLRQSFYGLDYSAGFQAQLPDLPKLVALGRLLALAAQQAQERGEVNRAVLSLRSLGSLASSLEREAGLSPYSAGLLLERWQLIGVAQAISTDGLFSKKATVLLGGLSEENLLKGFGKVVGLEEASLRQALPPKRGWAVFLANEWLRLHGSRRALALAELATRPVVRWRERFTKGPLENHEFLLLVTLAQAQGVQTSRRLVAAALVCTQHAASHGELPKSLGVIPEATKPDPFTGETLVFDASQGCLAIKQGEKIWGELMLPSPPPIFSLCLPRGGKA